MSKDIFNRRQKINFGDPDSLNERRHLKEDFNKLRKHERSYSPLRPLRTNNKILVDGQILTDREDPCYRAYINDLSTGSPVHQQILKTYIDKFATDKLQNLELVTQCSHQDPYAAYDHNRRTLRVN